MDDRPCRVEPWLGIRRREARTSGIVAVAPDAPGSLGGMGSPQPPPVTGISELVLEVSDLDRARAFYRDLLGFEETRYGEGREDRRWFLVGESARLGLWTPQVGLAGGQGGAHVHFAFHLDEADFEPLLERLQAAGVEVEGPVQLGPGRSVYVTDPDGHVVEFWTQSMVDYTAGARAGGGPGRLPAP